MGTFWVRYCTVCSAVRDGTTAPLGVEHAEIASAVAVLSTPARDLRMVTWFPSSGSVLGGCLTGVDHRIRQSSPELGKARQVGGGLRRSVAARASLAPTVQRLGSAAARKLSIRQCGRRPKLTPATLATARQLYDAKDKTVAEIAEIVGVARSTLYRAFEEGR